MALKHFSGGPETPSSNYHSIENQYQELSILCYLESSKEEYKGISVLESSFTHLRDIWEISGASDGTKVVLQNNFAYTNIISVPKYHKVFKLNLILNRKLDWKVAGIFL